MTPDWLHASMAGLDPAIRYLSNPYAYTFVAGWLAGMATMRRITRWALGGTR